MHAQGEFRFNFYIPHSAPVPNRKTISVWADNLKTTGQTLKRRGGSVQTPKNVKIVYG